MKKIILTESQVRKLIGKTINEQNEIRSQSINVPFGSVFNPGKYIITDEQASSFANELTKIVEFIKGNTGSEISIQIQAGESQITNFDREKNDGKQLQPGVLSKYRADSLINWLKNYFQQLVSKKVIAKMPVFPEPVVTVGKTNYDKNEYVKLCGKNKMDTPGCQTFLQPYIREQFISANISAKKDYDCIVGLNITIGYIKGTSTAKHDCDEAIFDLRMNGVSLGIVNLNNGEYDVLDIAKPPKSANYRAKIRKMDVNAYLNAVVQKNEELAKYGRKTDNARGGTRTQTFVIDGAKAKSIIDNSQANNITISIIPLVGRETPYNVYFNDGSHSDTPYVRISDKAGTILFSGEPNVKMTRGSMDETLLLRTDTCGKPITQ